MGQYKRRVELQMTEEDYRLLVENIYPPGNHNICFFSKSRTAFSQNVMFLGEKTDIWEKAVIIYVQSEHQEGGVDGLLQADVYKARKP